MFVAKSTDVEEVKIETFPYRDRILNVKSVSVRWLSKGGQDQKGMPTYGLRLFTVGPEGEIPIHNHRYVQTMYILTGEFECWQFHEQTDEVVETKICCPGDVIFIPSMESHGMRNTSTTEAGTFLCCIAELADDQTGTCAGGVCM